MTAGASGLARLPLWLAPRDADTPTRRQWLAETAVLVIVGIVLAVTSINDIFWTVNNSARLVADINTWRDHTHRDYFNVSAGPLVTGQPIDVACADSTPGPPGERTQICLLLDGPVVGGQRKVVGGWMLPARTGDFPAARYDCYGAGATKTLCPSG